MPSTPQKSVEEKETKSADSASGRAVATIFEEMPGVFNADKAAGVEVVFQYEITGDGGGSWYVAIANNVCKVEKGKHASPFHHHPDGSFRFSCTDEQAGQFNGTVYLGQTENQRRSDEIPAYRKAVHVLRRNAMSTGIKDKVAIIGMGCTRFGERWDCGAEELMVEAFTECLQDSGLETNDIQAAWLGTCMDEVNVGKSALPLSTTLRLPFIPVTRVENYCASGTESFRGAVYAVASGAYDVALAMGVEKLKDTGYGGLPNPGSGAGSLAWLWWAEFVGSRCIRTACFGLFRKI